MGMQKNAWMTGHLFEKWLNHFVDYLEKRGGISPSNRHLLILDGHNSHITIEVIERAWSLSIDMITLPSHTSHALQPLDVGCFRSFKQVFRIYRDMWTMNNRGQGAMKSTLAKWMSLGLKKALTSSNIKSGFKVIGIYSLNAHACDKHFGPSEGFASGKSEEMEEESDCSDQGEISYDELLQEAHEDTVDNTQTQNDNEDNDLADGIESDDDSDLEGWEEPLAGGYEL
jgi:hypothetical protein